jgi:hypothetical protein
MKYFTPELYLRFNSRDRQVVARAHDEWEEAVTQYRAHLRSIASKLTPPVLELATTLDLHDAALLGLTWMPLPVLGSVWGGAAESKSVVVLTAKKDATVDFLLYVMAAEPVIEEVKERWPYSKEGVHWLYDEYDVDADGQLRHEILLSNGRLIKLKFHAAQLIKQAFNGQLAVA